MTWQSMDQDGALDGVYGQLFGSSRSRLGNEFQVNTYTSDNQKEPAVATLVNGNFVVVWHSLGQDGSDYGVYGQIFHNNLSTTMGTSGWATSSSFGTSNPSTNSGGTSGSASTTHTSGTSLPTGTTGSSTFTATSSNPSTNNGGTSSSASAAPTSGTSLPTGTTGIFTATSSSPTTTLALSTSQAAVTGSSSESNSTLLLAILLPSAGICLLAIPGAYLLYRHRRNSAPSGKERASDPIDLDQIKNIKSSQQNAH